LKVTYDASEMHVSEQGVENVFWPLTRSEHEASRDALLSGLVSVARARGDELDVERDLLAAMLQLLMREGLALLMIYSIGRRAKEKGHHVIWPAGNRQCMAIGAGEAPSVNDSVILRALRKGPACHPKWRRYPVRLRRDLKYNGWGWSSFRLLRADRDVVACHTTDVLEEHARSVPVTVKYTLLGEWFTALDEDSAEVYDATPLAPELTSDIVAVLQNAFAAIDETLPEILAKYFETCVTRGARLARVHIDRILSKPDKVPRQLWTGSGGYIWVRLLRHAVRRLGGEVTGHEHGTGESIVRYFNTKTFSDLESVDRFVLFNSNQRRWLEDTIDERFLVPRERPETLVPDYRKDLVRYAGRPLRGSRNERQAVDAPLRIMYVGPIYVGFSPRPNNHNSDILLIDWQARLFAKLRDWGFDVLFKPHPEGEQRPPRGFVEKLGVREINQPFEHVWNQADIFLFDWKSTTAFSTAISTGLPVVLIDFHFQLFAPEMQALVEENCSLVEGWADESNRLQIDWNALHQAVEHQPAGNSSIVRETAFRFA